MFFWWFRFADWGLSKLDEELWSNLQLAFWIYHWYSLHYFQIWSIQNISETLLALQRRFYRSSCSIFPKSWATLLKCSTILLSYYTCVNTFRRIAIKLSWIVCSMCLNYLAISSVAYFNILSNYLLEFYKLLRKSERLFKLSLLSFSRNNCFIYSRNIFKGRIWCSSWLFILQTGQIKPLLEQDESTQTRFKI